MTTTLSARTGSPVTNVGNQRLHGSLLVTLICLARQTGRDGIPPWSIHCPHGGLSRDLTGDRKACTAAVAVPKVNF